MTPLAGIVGGFVMASRLFTEAVAAFEINKAIITLMFMAMIGGMYAFSTTVGVMPIVRTFLPKSTWRHSLVFVLAAMISGGSFLMIFNYRKFTQENVRFVTSEAQQWDFKTLAELTPEERVYMERQERKSHNIPPDASVDMLTGRNYVVLGPPIITHRVEFGDGFWLSLAGMLSAVIVSPLFLLLTKPRTEKTPFWHRAPE